LAYNTNFVSEIGRETCDYAGGEEFMIAEDLIENLIRQKDEVRKAAKHSNRLLFVDTDALTTGFYCDFLLKEEKQIKEMTDLAESIHKTNSWDLVLFLEPEGTNFVQDGTRSQQIEAEREYYSNRLKEWFDKNNVIYHSVSGNYLDRFNKAKQLIGRELKISTQF